MKPRLLLSLLLLVCSRAAADVAPATYYGRTLTPIANSEVRLESETVDIYVGNPFSDSSYVRSVRVKARFNMINERPDTCHIRVGFPILAHSSELKTYEDWGIYDFKVIVSGADSITPVPEQVEGAYESRMKTPNLWFGWEMNFPPGPTVIDVEYTVRSNYTYARCYQNIGYILHTGSYWKGTIDRALIRVTFPSEFDPALLMAPGTTPGYKIDSTTLVWSLEDFEPGRKDDIHVEFMPPELNAKIEALRTKLASEPGNVEALVALARLYLRAAYIKGPEHSERTGYRDFAGMAERLLKEAVWLNPCNALAWNTYISSYFRMHDSVFGPGWHKQFPMVEAQRELINQAYRYYPEDPGIRSWFELANESHWQFPDTLGWTRKDRRSPASITILTSRYTGFLQKFSDNEIALVMSYYDSKDWRTGRDSQRVWLVRNAVAIPPDDRERLIELLENAFVERMIMQIIIYNRRAGI